MPDLHRQIRRRWRFYETPAGKKPVEEFIDKLSDEDAASVVAAMEDVGEFGLTEARHLHGDIWEVRASGAHATFRILFSSEGKRGRILLAIDGFSKKTQQTPKRIIDNAERALRDWRARGEELRAARERNSKR